MVDWHRWLSTIGITCQIRVSGINPRSGTPQHLVPCDHWHRHINRSHEVINNLRLLHAHSTPWIVDLHHLLLPVIHHITLWRLYTPDHDPCIINVLLLGLILAQSTLDLLHPDFLYAVDIIV